MERKVVAKTDNADFAVIDHLEALGTDPSEERFDLDLAAPDRQSSQPYQGMRRGDLSFGHAVVAFDQMKQIRVLLSANVGEIGDDVVPIGKPSKSFEHHLRSANQSTRFRQKPIKILRVPDDARSAEIHHIL